MFSCLQRRSALALGMALALGSGYTTAGVEIITFDDAIDGLPFYNFDSNDADTTTDVVFSTTDPLGFNTAGPGPSQKYIDEPGLEGTTALPVDLRVDLLQGAIGTISVGFALIQDGQATFTAYDADGNVVGTSTVVGDYFQLDNASSPDTEFPGDGTSFFPENEIVVNLSGTAVYGEFDFEIIDGTSGETGGEGRYIIDNFSYTPAGEEIISVVQGALPDDPLLPGGIIIGENGVPEFQFDVNIDEDGLGGVFPIFIDPVIAVGYDYTSTINVASVLIPDPLPNGDSEFELVIPGVGTFALTAGTAFDLTTLDPAGFGAFTIQGIDTTELLDPNDPTAFVTGLTFVGGSAATTPVASVTMTPITLNVPTGGTAGVPEPHIAWLFGLGLAGLMARRYGRR